MGRAPHLCLLGIVILSSLLNLFALRKGHSWGDDFALYLAQAVSLVEGTTETLLHQNTFAMSHSSYPSGPNLYPWGFPIILSPIYAAFGLSLLPMKILEIFFFEASVVVLFYIFLRRLGNILTLLSISLFAFNPYFLLLNDHLISDVPFLFFSFLSILLIEKFLIERPLSDHRFISSIITGLLIFLSYSIRTIGFVLVLSLFIVQMISIIRIYPIDYLKRSVPNKIFFLPYLTFGVCALIMHMLQPSGSGSYLSFFSYVNLPMIMRHIYYYINLPSEFFGPYFGSIIYGLSLPFVFSGIRSNYRTNSLYLFYSTLLLFILILAPFVQGLRYILPIMPFFVYFLCIGLKNFYSRPYLSMNSSKLMSGYPIIFMVAIVCLPTLYSIQISFSNFYNDRVMDGPFTEQSIEMFNFVSIHTNKDDIIVFFKPKAFLLMTGRRSIMLLSLPEIMKSSADYLAINKGADGSTQLSPHSKEFAQVLQEFPIVFENADFTIFRLKKLAEFN
jgi:Dolichyl-phosphate-mannose-protein mannosyltransferase